MTELREVELLAPAGNPAVALAAFDAGADAVYCGLRKFNARERSENFSREEMARMIAYAHKNRRKLYVVFNTLLKESELVEAAQEMAFLAECRPDAVIVQDLGAARMMREYFPELTLHASTQLGIHNSAGLEMAKRFGFKRVILERQVTLDELRRMIPSGGPPLELEVFIHGALCCCVSGSCLFSSWLGGWSGNRGKCKQPCRRRYFPAEDSGRGQGEFLFSPDDLCSLELLDEFRRLGICSLKIEGRLRRADYVEKVVRAYRTVLDAEPDRRRDAVGEARKILRGAIARRPSIGFYSQDSMRKLIRPDFSGGSGIPCGRVKKAVPGGFEAEISGRLHVGDTIRLQSDSDAGDGFNMTVLQLKKGGNSVLKVQSGERCFIRSEQNPVSGTLIYRTGESGADLSARIARLPLPKVPLDLQIVLSCDTLTIRIAGSELQYRIEFPALVPARTQAVAPVQLQNAFSIAGPGSFSAGKISASVAGEWFLPSGRLKELRRDFWNWAETRVPHDLHQKKIQKSLHRFLEDLKKLEAMERPVKFPDCIAVREPADRAGNTAMDIDFATPADEVILPPFVPEDQLESLRRKINALLERGTKIFRLTSFFQFALFPDRRRDRILLKTMFPFPVCNSQTLLVCREAGASGVQAWLELAQKDYDDLMRRSVLPLEAYVYGRPCIFLSRALIPAPQRIIQDMRSNRFELEKNGSLTGLYPEPTLKISLPAGFSGFQDLRKASCGPESPEKWTDFNFSRGWA